MSMRHVIPIIDLSPMRGADKAAQHAVGRAVDEAFRTVGFCYAVGHGVPQALIDGAFNVSADFFALPLAAKQTAAVDALFRGYTGPKTTLNASSDEDDSGKWIDGKEMFNFSLEAPAGDPDSQPDGWTYGPNNWPPAMPEFRETLYSYYEAVCQTGADLLRAVALNLDIPEDFFSGKFRRTIGQCTALHYSPLSDAEVAAGIESSIAHCDWGAVTLLYQDEVGGLEVRERSSGEWIAAPPIPGAFVVNVGDMLARWTNDRYVSTPHRVMNRSGRERYSIGVFYNPSASALVDARELGCAEKDCRYAPIQSGKYIRSRFEELYT